ncbi:MAG: hypothetical protein LUI06_05635 [Ruminococcus sp.]|nr:hypothetical protein [Ruminococcus sp.]
MEYKYGELSYSRRDFLSDTALYVVSDKLPETDEERRKFEQKAKPYKLGELAAQTDSCPIVNLKHLKDRVDFLKRTFDGFRIRNVVLSAVLSVDYKITGIARDTAEFLIAAGSTAILARGYDDVSKKILVDNGILPLVTDEAIENGSLILIRSLENRDSILSHRVFSDRIEEIKVTF